MCIRDRCLVEGAITVLGGDPASGKTSLAAAMVLSAASARDLVREPARDPLRDLRALVWASDEGAHQFALMLAALCEHHGVVPPAGAIEIVGSLEGGELRDWDGQIMATEADDPGAGLEPVLAAMDADGRDLLVIDSLSTVAPAAEGDNALATALMTTIEQAMRDRGACCVLLHHNRKPTPGMTEAPDMHRLRGASAISARARVVWALQVEPAKEDAPRRIVGTNVKASRGEPEPPITLAFTAAEVRGRIKGEERLTPFEVGLVVPAVAPDPLEGLSPLSAVRVLDEALDDPAACRRFPNSLGWLGLALIGGCNLEGENPDEDAKRAARTHARRTLHRLELAGFLAQGTTTTTTGRKKGRETPIWTRGKRRLMELLP